MFANMASAIQDKERQVRRMRHTQRHSLKHTGLQPLMHRPVALKAKGCSLVRHTSGHVSGCNCASARWRKTRRRGQARRRRRRRPRKWRRRRRRRRRGMGPDPEWATVHTSQSVHCVELASPHSPPHALIPSSTHARTHAHHPRPHLHSSPQGGFAWGGRPLLPSGCTFALSRLCPPPPALQASPGMAASLRARGETRLRAEAVRVRVRVRVRFRVRVRVRVRRLGG